jgi:hypothetical protein
MISPQRKAKLIKNNLIKKKKKHEFVRKNEEI